MQWAVATGVLGGNADGTLAPQRSTTRAETAAMLTHFTALTDNA